MRMYLKRFVLVILGACATTILVTFMNSLSANAGRDEKMFASSKEAIIAGLRPLNKQSPENAISMVNTLEKLDHNAQISNGDNRMQNGPDSPGRLTTVPGPVLQKKDKKYRNRTLKEKKKPVLENNAVAELKEAPWARDDRVVVPEDFGRDAAPGPRRVDPKLSALRQRLHLNDYVPPTTECPNKTTLEDYYWKRYRKPWPKDDSWDSFYAQIGSCDLYRENSPVLQTLLDDLTTLPIKSVTNMDGGTQIKLILTFENGKRAVFKPQRFSRAYETDPNHFYFSDFERHHAEIAAFHLDKILGFRRAVPTVGRVVNISSDLWANADKSLAKTFFISPVKNLCFVGKCDYYCDTTHAICGNPDLKEGSTQMFLPDEEIVPRDHNKSPYKRTYSKRNQDADWQKDSSYCSWKVKYTPPFSNGRRLLDLVDLYILDFLMGNQDRHHYETLAVFENMPSYFVHLDNGRAFGKPRFDDMSILAPLMQCCVIRPATAKTLLDYYDGPVSLSEALRKSMSRDPVAPILAEKYFLALDRRLEIVLRELNSCLDRAQGDYKKVILNTFYNPDAPTEVEEEEEDDDD